jgi:transketolase N-terminal domain/subunit
MVYYSMAGRNHLCVWDFWCYGPNCLGYLKYMNDLERRIIEISYKRKLSHVSSCLNCVNQIFQIYQQKQDSEPFVLGNSHAALALYVVLERYGLCDAEKMSETYGTHASRDVPHGVWVSGGSLGQAETISVGLALANRKRKVWLMTSDGACMEGAVSEAFRVAQEQNLTNLDITVIANGYGAYREIDVQRFTDVLHAILNPLPFRVFTPVMPYEWLQGLAGHYLQLSTEQYEEAIV